MKIYDMGSSTQYNNPIWNGDGFIEDLPHQLWTRLPDSLREIAIEEVSRGNTPESILENRESNIVILSFVRGPYVDQQTNNSLIIHTVHQVGNYCYDGTKVTYEDIQSGCFLAFEDPDHIEDAF